MLTGQSILCFAPDPWDDLWRNRHQIMSQLCQSNTVLYVEPRPYMRSVLRDLRRGQFGPRGPRMRQVRPNLYVYRSPRYAPLSGRPPLSTWTEALRDADLRRTMRRLGMERPILWLFRPDMADLPGRYGERFMIYHVVDEYTGYADVEGADVAGRIADIRRRERGLIADADLVLVTSKTLLASKGGINPNTHWVPNAVDYPAFAAAARNGEEPQELAATPPPRIGYVGAVNDKLDLGLLIAVAQAYPQVALLVVGPERLTSDEARRNMERLRALENVRLLGQVPVERVPEFVAACNVGLLPYAQNAWTEAIHPLKLYEYLACGLPVVASAIPSVREEADAAPDLGIAVAEDRAAFVASVGRALAEDEPQRRALRQKRAAQNTWSHRVERISELVALGLQRDGG